MTKKGGAVFLRDRQNITLDKKLDALFDGKLERSESEQSPDIRLAHTTLEELYELARSLNLPIVAEEVIFLGPQPKKQGYIV